MSSYCKYIATLDPSTENIHRNYHDHKYGFPVKTDDELFGRLILEINQAGLSWTTILNKESNFRKAYHKFNIKKVASYGEKDFKRLMADAGIIRNRLKINAAIENAKTILKLQQSHGSFSNWLLAHHPSSKEEWTRLFRKTFLFTGGEIVNEFLMSSGFLEGAHEKTCPVYQSIIASEPPWLTKK